MVYVGDTLRTNAAAPAGDAERPFPPRSFEEYRLIRSLGKGTMGEVWLAYDTLLDRHVAIKFISDLAPDDDLRRQFLVEARAAARLQHPNVLTVFRVGSPISSRSSRPSGTRPSPRSWPRRSAGSRRRCRACGCS